MTLRQRLATALILLPVAGCASHAPPQALLTPEQVRTLVTNHTLQVVECKPGGSAIGCWLKDCSCASHPQTVLYLASDGTGWLDDAVIAGSAPRPGNISKVIDWRVTGPSQLCLWAAPTIGDMQSFVPPQQQCLDVLPAASADKPMRAVIAADGARRSGMLTLYPFNAFPPAVLAQYDVQVRVLYGGHLPDWSHP